MKWNYKEFLEVFKSGLNKEGGNIFEDLGYRVSFYSSLEEDNSFAHSLKIGSTSSWNVLTISVAISINLNDVTMGYKYSVRYSEVKSILCDDVIRQYAIKVRCEIEKFVNDYVPQIVIFYESVPDWYEWE